MGKVKQSSGGGISFCGLLAIVFITLKLCSVIDWSWWWVLSPLWIPIAAVFGALAICVFLMGVCALGLHFLDKEKP